MNLRQYLSVLAIGTAASLSAWCIVVIAIDPVTAGALAFFVFYLTLASGLIGFFTIIGTIVRAGRYDELHLNTVVARSFRQAIFLSALVILSLYLMGRGLFSTPILFLTIGILGFIEFLFLFHQDRTKDEQG